ncbi:MAG: hypothetical protein OHK0046_24060 [Anaerolineae bacterium]
MTLPTHFVFSQTSLRDYVECPRRFELRYIQGLKWPAVESEPVVEREQHMQRGADFHHMVHQHSLGIPAEVLSARVMDQQLAGWWRNYLNADLLHTLPARRYAEIQLTAPLLNYRLVAKFDLLALGERAVIVDWKTSERKPKDLDTAMQTRVYRYVLAAGGAGLNGGLPIPPEQIEMMYWFAALPESPEHLPYTTAQYDADRDYLETLVREIETRRVFDLTTDTRRCAFCTYRSLCERGVRAGAGDPDSVDEDFDPDDFNFDQIAEVEF